jgi:beta-lactam-binding protein with PASTA domain
VSAIRQTLTILKRIAIVVGIAIAFSLGLLGAIYLSLRSSETRVPDIVGKDRGTAENAISDAGLNFRVRAMRATSEAKPDTVLIQLPHAGEIVKVGQTVAVDISRPTQDGEAPAETNTNNNTETSNTNKTESNSSGNTNANSNTNKEKKKPANRNGNANANGNTNRPANRNLNGNANRPTNSGNVNTSPRGNLNANGTPARTNTNRGAGNSNTPRRLPATAPTP